MSKLLTHSNLATTQVYAEVVSELKRDASERISLKDDAKESATSEEVKNEETTNEASAGRSSLQPCLARRSKSEAQTLAH